MATERVDVIVTDDGTVTVANRLKGIGDAAQKGQSGVDLLNKSLARTRTGSNSFNVGNIAAQFQDIGVTAAMMQNPLQIALQQGTQLSAVFSMSGGGLGGVLKQLGAAFAQVFSPISILTIALVALVAAGLQMVDWMKLAATTLIPLSQYATEFLNYIQQYPGILIAVGAAMLVAFGPPVLAAVTSLYIAISKSLYGAIASVFTLILANPVTATIAAIAAAISYVITTTIGWQAAIQKVIEVWGGVVKVIGVITDYFGLTNGLSGMGQEIINGAETAAANIYANLKGGSDYLIRSAKDGLMQGREWLRDGVDKGAQSGAERLKKGMVDGAELAAQRQKEAQDLAIAKYEDMNGKAVKEIGQALVDGGKYLYNELTHEVTKASADAGKTMNDSIQKGGDVAANSMGTAIEKAGSNVSLTLSSTMSDILVGFQQFGGDLIQTMDQIRQTINGQIAVLNATANNLNAQANKADADAQKIRHELFGSGSKGGSGSGSGSGNYGGSSSGGGGGGVSGPTTRYAGVNGAGIFGGFNPDTTASPQSGATSSETTTTTVGAPINVGIQNVFDPNAIPIANQSVAGQKSIVNVITANRDLISRILGIA